MPTAYPSIKPFAYPTDVPIMGISWEAWDKGFTATFGVGTSMINDPADKTTIKTRYGDRAPVKSDGTAYPDNWYILRSSAGNAVEQAVWDDQIDMLAAANIVRMIDWYPRESLVLVGARPDVCDIAAASRDRHFGSTRKNKQKICYMLQNHWQGYDGNTPGTWLNETGFINSQVADMLDPTYLKITQGGIANRPVIGIFSSGTPAWDLTHIGNITTAVTTAGMGTPIYIEMTGDGTNSNNLNMNYISAYGPSGTVLSGTHNAYSAQITKCKTIDTLAGVNASRCLPLVTALDGRPRGDPSWCDNPIYTELEQFIQDRVATARAEMNRDPGHLICVYSLTELDEGGAFFPTLQSIIRGVNTPSRGPYLDAFKNVIFGTKPSTYDDHYHAYSFHANVGSGLPVGWALVQDLYGASGGTTGAYQYAEIQNSTTANARTWTVTGTRFKVYGAARAGMGTIRIVFDGGANNDVDQSIPVGSGYNQLLFDSGAVANSSHTVAISRVSGTVGFDEIVVSMSR